MMNVKESNLLARADRMSESTLVNLQDWELAYLRVAMLRQLEETLEGSLADHDSGYEDQPVACVGRDRELAGSTVSEDKR